MPIIWSPLARGNDQYLKAKDQRIRYLKLTSTFTLSCVANNLKCAKNMP